MREKKGEKRGEESSEMRGDRRDESGEFYELIEVQQREGTRDHSNLHQGHRSVRTQHTNTHSHKVVVSKARAVCALVCVYLCEVYCTCSREHRYTQ